MFRILKKIFIRFYLNRINKKIKSKGINVVLNYPIYVEYPEKFVIGNHVYIGYNAWISNKGEVTIKNGTILGPRVRIHTGNHNYDSEIAIPYDHIMVIKPVIIEENVWIGADVTILPGVIISEGAIIGAGSVVTKSIPKGAIVAGNPAKILKYRDIEKYDRLKSQNAVYLRFKQEGILIPKNE